MRSAGRYLVPIKMESDRDTGMFTWHCRVEEVDAQGNVQQGPIKLWGGDSEMLVSKHSGSHQDFLVNYVKPLALTHYAAWTASHSEAKSLEGSSL